MGDARARCRRRRRLRERTSQERFDEAVRSGEDDGRGPVERDKEATPVAVSGPVHERQASFYNLKTASLLHGTPSWIGSREKRHGESQKRYGPQANDSSPSD